MLASEQAARDVLDNLHLRSAAFLRHAQHDEKIRLATGESVALNERIKALILTFVEAYRRVVELRLRGVDFGTFFNAAERALTEWENLIPRASELMENQIRMLYQRAEISVTPVDRPALEAGVSEIRRRLNGLAQQARLNRERLEAERSANRRL